MRKILTVFLLLCLFSTTLSIGQEIAVLKYGGGGDWYSNPTALPNLIQFCNKNIGTKLKAKPETVETGSVNIFQYPMVHMTGHGNVFFSESDAENLRNYLISGGFLHIDDNYGMEPYITKELKKVFPNKDLVELSNNHPIFNQAFEFPKGLPKIHEHDGKRPQAFGLFHEDRLVLLFTFEDFWQAVEIRKLKLIPVYIQELSSA